MRARLIKRLDRSRSAKLSVLSAPPGFGKTSLLAAWIATLPREEQTLAWLSLEVSDNAPATFWTYVLLSLRNASPALGAAALSMLEAPQRPAMRAVLTSLLNDVAAETTSLLLVLDDYHVIENREIHDDLGFLIDHLPPHMHLLIASRADPPVQLARLRVRGELVEIRAADLRFTVEEAATFLDQAMGLELAQDQVMALESRTEGWIAALQLAAVSMQGRQDTAGFIEAFTGNDRYIVDYLVEEVLDRQPPGVRDFLLQTSVLDRLNASLADAVTGRTDGKAVLDLLERGNLFVAPLDDNRRWFRYHHLFADVLRARLVDLRSDEVPALHRRASAWYADNGERPLAIRHALAAGDPGRAAELVELDAQAIVQAHRPDRLIELLRSIPDEHIRRMPVLSTYYGHALQGMGDLRGSAARLDDAERLLRQADDNVPVVVADPQSLLSLPARIAVGRGYLAIAADDIAATVTHARLALELVAPDEHHWRGTASALLGLALWKQGELDEAQSLHTQAGGHFERSGDTGLAITSAYHDAELLKARGRLSEARLRNERSLEFAREHPSAMRYAPNLHLGLSELCCERYELAAAEQHLRAAESLGIYPPRTPYRYKLARALLLQCEGDIKGALVLLDEALRERVAGAVPDLRPVEAWIARLWIADGRLHDALQWARDCGLSLQDEPRYLREYEQITLAKVMLAQSQADPGKTSLDTLSGFLDRMLRAARAGGRHGAALELTVLQALCADAQEDSSAALATLRQALSLAEPEGYVRVFAAEGAPLLRLLAKAATADPGGRYARHVLTAIAAAGNPFRLESKPTPPGLPEGLTQREVEVLRLVASGLQNQEIADQLVLSLATVKRHIANVYGKLDVSHRTAAVARA
ncbi:hypothetical protein AYO38_06570, partial [bacterium SCGC AG-212-C10]